MKKFYTMIKTFFLLSICLLALLNYGHAQVTQTEISFDGTNDFMFIDYIDELEYVYTFEFYFRVDSIPAGEGTFWNFDGSDFSPWCGIGSDSSVSVYDYDDYYYWTESGTILPDITYHVAFVWDGYEGRLYLDGVLQDAQAIPITIPDGYFTVGDTEADGGYPFNGYIDEFRISDIDRYTGTIVTIDPPPWEFDSYTIAMFHFNECSGQVAFSEGGIEMILGSTPDPDDYDPAWDCSVGVSEKDFENKITVYPNPASTELFISTNNGIKLAEVTISNQVGQKVLHLKPVTQPIDVSMLKPGLYVLEVVYGNKRMRGKFIK